MRGDFIIRAFPAVVLGAALFFSGCAGQPRVETRSAVSVRAGANYRAGMEYLKEGASNKALEAFSRALEEDPQGETAPAAMHRIAQIHRLQRENRQALDWLQRLEKAFPQYKDAAGARFLKVETLLSLGELEQAETEGASWAESNRSHRLYPEMCTMLGDMSLRSGDLSSAFRWWLEAHEAGEDPALRGRARDRLGEIVDAMDADDLVRAANFAAGTDMAPKIYLRSAEEYLSTGDVEKAEEAAVALMRSSPGGEWGDIGKNLMARIRDELSVKRNLVGCMLPQSGPFALYGRELLRGIHLGLAMAAEEAGSGRSGPDIEVVIEDSAGEPEAAEKGLMRLAGEERVIAVVGPLSSNAAEVVAEKSQSLGVPLIAVTQKEGITEAGDMVFRNFIYPSLEVKRLLDGAMKSLGMDRFAVLYPENSYGRHFMRLFRDAAADRGAMVTAVAGYEPGTTDFAVPIKKLVSLDSPRRRGVDDELIAQWPAERLEMEAYPDKPQPIVDFDAVFVPDSFDGVAMLAPQLLYHDVTDVVLLGTSVWQSPHLLEQAGRHIQGAMFTTGFFEESNRPGVASFVETYRAWFGAEPGILSATGYDTIRFLSGLLEGTDVRTRMSLRFAIASSPPFAGVTGDISFDETGEIEKEPFLLTVHGTRFIEF